MLSLIYLQRAIKVYGKEITRKQYQKFAKENNYPGLDRLEEDFDFSSGVKILSDPLFNDREFKVSTFCFECTEFKDCRLEFKDCPYQDKIDDYFKEVSYW